LYLRGNKTGAQPDTKLAQLHMTTSQNGTAKKTETPVNGTTTPQAATPQLPEVKKLLPERKEKPTIQERMAKFDALTKILERRETVADALERLNNFFIAQTGNGCSLKLSDSKGESFSISNSAVIAEMVNLAKTKLEAELETIDNQFDFTI
jgi:hypothetical protein